jgi:glucosamine--fructose-6-phosphate aminotransferase (isomerizing)
MCGIVGFLGSYNFKQYIQTGLELLQNRGYDSVGVSFITNEKKLETIKFANENHDSLKMLEENMRNLDIESYLAIGHTRWATHGPKTKTNAHPHQDNDKKISLVHNGIIENYSQLKLALMEEGYFFVSQTDTEIISVLIGKFLKEGNDMNISIQKTTSMLSGTWALAIIHEDFPTKLWITRNGSPLLLGMEEDYVMIASEKIAFSNYITRYIALENNDIIEITKEGNSIKYNIDIHKNYTVREKENILIEVTPEPYKHWMLKEIFEQPHAIVRAFNNGGRIESTSSVKFGGLEDSKSLLLDMNHIILLGCGTSYHAGLWSLDIFKSLEIFDTVSIFDGAEFSIKDIPRQGKTGIILLSQSGETKDLHRCIQIARENELVTIGIVNVPDSLIARETDCGVYLNAGREVAVASTKSFTNQCIILSLVACWFSQKKGTMVERRKMIIQDLQNLYLQMKYILDTAETSIKSIVEKLADKEHMFILGKGSNHAIALEGSLKFKEVSYIHAEGYSSSALKHGPFALITDGLPIVILDIDETHRDKNNNAEQEVYARNAIVLKISDLYDKSSNPMHLKIHQNHTYGGLLANCYLQLISYYLAIERGINPDFPRNLAKVVTVE